MSRNDLEMSSLVSTPIDEDHPASEEVFATRQSSDISTRHLSRPSTDGPKTPPSETLSNSERPKKAFVAGKLSTIGHLAIYHLPAISITLALVCLYSVHIRWGDLDNEQLSLLQFAAKGHEMLILISLTKILMHKIRSGLLLDSSGIPLGFLSAPFNIGSPVQYFFSWELWASLLRPKTKVIHANGGTQITGLTIFIAIILSISIAPLSAIAIIPRTGWFQITTPIEQMAVYYFEGPQWETNLHSKPDHRYLTYDSTFVNRLKRLQPVIDNIPGVERLSSTRQIANVSFSAKIPKLSISLTMDFPQLESQDTKYLVVATSPMTGVVELLDTDWDGKPMDVHTTAWQQRLDFNTSDWWDLKKSARKDLWKKIGAASVHRWKQPVVAVECVANETVGDTSTFRFDTNISDTEVLLDGRNDKEFKKFLQRARQRKGNPEVEYLIMDPIDNSDSPPSTFILSPWEVPRRDFTLSLCRVHARWIEADTWFEQGQPSVQTHLDSPLFDADAQFGRTDSSQRNIKLSKEWLNATSYVWESSEFPTSNTSYQHIIDFCTSKHPEGRATDSGCLSVSLSVYLTDLLSQSGRANHFPSSKSKLSTSDVIIHEEYFIGGYGYSWNSSRTIPLAFSVLLLHVLIVLVHVVTVLWSRHPWHSSSWSSFGQMMILALRSTAPEGLGSVGAGVSSSETWSRSVAVRVVDAEDRLEMILQDEKEVVSQDQELDSGAEEAGRDTGLSFARPGVKYH